MNNRVELLIDLSQCLRRVTMQPCQPTTWLLSFFLETPLSPVFIYGHRLEQRQDLLVVQRQKHDFARAKDAQRCRFLASTGSPLLTTQRAKGAFQIQVTAGQSRDIVAMQDVWQPSLGY